MKISTVIMGASMFCVTAAFGANSEESKGFALKNNYTVKLSAVTLNSTLKDIHRIDDINLGYKLTIKDNFSKTFYGQADIVKFHGNHVGYGVMMGRTSNAWHI